MFFGSKTDVCKCLVSVKIIVNSRKSLKSKNLVSSISFIYKIIKIALKLKLLQQ